MRWTSRLRLLIGVLLVVVVAGVATYHLNQTRGRAVSTSAQVLGQDLTVGAPYAGVVLDRHADVGTHVHQGDQLFVVDSATLSLARSTGARIPASTQVDAKGHLVVLATADGTVTAVKAEPGTYVQAGDNLATVQRTDSLFVEAQFTLTPKQYARVAAKAPVLLHLPDGTTVPGTADDVHVTTVDGQARAVATVSSPALSQAGSGTLVTAGAPVVAELELRNDGWVTRAGDAVQAYVRSLLARVTR
jgi:multidrug resistance efflux pump